MFKHLTWNTKMISWRDFEKFMSNKELCFFFRLKDNETCSESGIQIPTPKKNNFHSSTGRKQLYAKNNEKFTLKFFSTWWFQPIWTVFVK